MEPNVNFPQYTNWQIACYMWNHLNALSEDMDKYFKGRYNKKFNDNVSYVAHKQTMPETWEFNLAEFKKFKKKKTI
jgi:hypothetical protein